MVSYNQPLREALNIVEQEIEVTAAQVMERSYLSLDPSMSIIEASELISSHKLTGAPVVNKKNMLLGILSEKDCMKYLLDVKYYNGPAGMVRDYMSSTVMTIHESEKILYMAELFIKNNYQLYPVVDDDGILLGVVKRSKLFAELCKLSQTSW